MLPLLIAGAGPGGLVAAHALLRRGVDVVVLERQPTLSPVGAGIVIQVNAVRMLASLDLVAPVLAAGQRLGVATIDTAEGRLIQRSDLDAVAERFGQPGIGIHRGAFSRVLAERLPAGVLRLDAAIAGVEEQADAVAVTLHTGEVLRGRGLIGADGIRSAVRTAVFGLMELRYSGYTCWRGIAPMVEGWPPGRMFERWGRGRRFGMVPVSATEVYWFATLNTAEGGSDPVNVRHMLLDTFASFAEPVPTLIGSTAHILRNDIIDLPSLISWTHGRVALLGDAAHAMTPNLGQGACQAIEDAVVLAERIAAVADLPAAFEAYAALRRPRAQGVARQSLQIGRIAQWENSVARALRDMAVRYTPNSVVDRQLGELYGVAVP
jgi:2-polyprenyl-6-methoxyphenol hydroxylase-like FAD-dependent oxidoreductase